MEEKIYVNGVDVSECKYYVPYTKDCINDNKSYDKCKSCKDCYYKQLKRLEQENEELKQTIKDLTQSLDDCNVDRTKLYKKLDFEMQKREEFADKSIKYKFALEEIRELLPEQIDITELIYI